MQQEDSRAEEVHFGGKLRLYRTKLGLSLGELAKLVHYSKGYLSRIETGEKNASKGLAARCDEILQADGELILAFSASGVGKRPRKKATSPIQLPPTARHFTGRQRELSHVDLDVQKQCADRAGTARIMVIDGAPGVGKTTMALQWAHRHAAEFTDGILFQDLHGHGPEKEPLGTHDALAGFLHLLGVASDAVPVTVRERAAMYRTLVSRRRMLMVLDNAATADQVRSLLPDTPDCTVLVTSRNRLGGLVARDGASRLTLEPLSSDEAATLLRHASTRDLRDESPEALRHVVRLCGHLPLAVRIAAEHYSTGQYSSLAEMITVMESNLLEFLSCLHDPASSVRTAFSWSYQALDEGVAHAFQVMCAHLHKEITPRDAARLLGVPAGIAAQRLDALYQANLLVPTEPGRYRCNSLLAAYAGELSDVPAGSLSCICGCNREIS